MSAGGTLNKVNPVILWIKNSIFWVMKSKFGRRESRWFLVLAKDKPLKRLVFDLKKNKERTTARWDLRVLA
jgi:hypothetical protein